MKDMLNGSSSTKAKSHASITMKPLQQRNNKEKNYERATEQNSCFATQFTYKDITMMQE